MQSFAKVNAVRIQSPHADQDFGSGWVPKCNGDFLVQEYISDKNFHKNRISSVYVRLLQTDRQTDRWTNAGQNITTLAQVHVMRSLSDTPRVRSAVGVNCKQRTVERICSTGVLYAWNEWADERWPKWTGISNRPEHWPTSLSQTGI